MAFFSQSTNSKTQGNVFICKLSPEYLTDATFISLQRKITTHALNKITFTVYLKQRNNRDLNSCRLLCNLTMNKTRERLKRSACRGNC